MTRPPQAMSSCIYPPPKVLSDDLKLTGSFTSGSHQEQFRWNTSKIEERFGRRPFPRLALILEQHTMITSHGLDQQPLRLLSFGLKNEGRGIAKFPGLRFRYIPGFKKDDFGIDGNCGFGLPPRPSEYQWITFRGGVDDVIYPDETRMIGKLIQLAVKEEEKPLIRAGEPFFGDCERIWLCAAHTLHFEISAEGGATRSDTFPLQEDRYIQNFKTPTKPSAGFRR